jgi:hypothetical protein
MCFEEWGNTDACQTSLKSIQCIETTDQQENDMNIRTNNHARPLLGFYDLSEKERTEVGSAYDIVGAQFVRYKEWVYAMDDFVGTTAPEFEGWHGVYPESYFSGVLVRLSDDGETVQMGTYFC